MPKREVRPEHHSHAHSAGEWCFASLPLSSANALDVAMMSDALLLASIKTHEAEFTQQLAALPADLRLFVAEAAQAAGWNE